MGIADEIFQAARNAQTCADSLNDGGKILIINQEMEEYIMQEQLCKETGVCYELLGEVKSDFWSYKYKRYAIMVSKN
jgi:hypothetical protein